jgi:hypothetical protein
METIELYGIYVNFALIAVAEDKELAEERAREYSEVADVLDDKKPHSITVKAIKLIKVSNQLKSE